MSGPWFSAGLLTQFSNWLDMLDMLDEPGWLSAIVALIRQPGYGKLSYPESRLEIGMEIVCKSNNGLDMMA